MELPFTLHKKIVDFLTSLPNMHDDNNRRALIYSAGLDSQLQNKIRFNEPPEQFFELLVPMLRDYGKLADGRDALEVVLEAAKDYVGQDKDEDCEKLIQELHERLQNTQENPNQTFSNSSNNALGMKKISEIQNEKTQIQRLAAQRYIYDVARKWKGYRTIVTVPVAIGWGIIATLLFKNDIVTFFGGVLILLFDIVWLRQQEQGLRRKAASIQELFDCDVLQMERNDTLLGTPPAPDDVADYATLYDPKKYPNSPLKDWYSSKVDQLPLYLGRIVCQRSNLTWDEKLRSRHIKNIVRNVIFLVVVIAAGGIVLHVQHLSVWAFAFASLGPGLLFGLDEIHHNLSTIKLLNQLKTQTYNLWNQAFSGKANEDELVRASRQWQDEIYRHRQTCPLLPSDLYTKYRNTDEGAMWEGSAALVEEALKHLKKL